MAEDKILSIESVYAEHAKRSAAAQAVEAEKNKVRAFFGLLRAGHSLAKIVVWPGAKWNWEWITLTICEFIDWRKVWAFMRGNRKVETDHGRAA